jgi:Fanconi anemia group M protein
MENTTKPKIIADIREKNSLVIAELVHLGADVEMKHLNLADYIISQDIAIERKTINDFVSSVINKRLQSQLIDLKKNFKSPLLLIEKEDNHDIYKPSGHPSIHENAIRGMLLSIANFGVPFILTEGCEDTAQYLMLLAKRQLKPEQAISLSFKRKAFSLKNQQQIILESFPGIGPSTAKSLLKEFKTIKNIVNASEEELKKTKLGKKSSAVRRILDTIY